MGTWGGAQGGIRNLFKGYAATLAREVRRQPPFRGRVLVVMALVVVAQAICDYA
jgi:hypothetical protein